MPYVICLVSAMICIFRNLLKRRLRIVLAFAILTIASLIPESLLNNNRVTMAVSVWAPFS